MKAERVVENLNRAIHNLFASDPSVYLIGEDILDPYGGAFKVSKGLSITYPDRVITTPISEGSIVGFGLGMALCGDKPIVEIMFGDFIGYAFDQIWNVASKFVRMYGRKLDLNILIRCPVGGNRGYGATHSQSPQKFFIGMPDLELFEITPFHNNIPLINRLVNRGNPVLLFENKVLYTEYMYQNGQSGKLFQYEFIGPNQEFVKIFNGDMENPEAIVLTQGGLVSRCLKAAEKLFINEEIESQILVSYQLYPFPLDLIIDILQKSKYIFIIEEDTPGATWGSEVAINIYQKLENNSRIKLNIINSKNCIIPCSPHLEHEVIVQTEHIIEVIKNEVLK
jgi:pyruvate dehydrogenase E1 component beta subunit